MSYEEPKWSQGLRKLAEVAEQDTTLSADIAELKQHAEAKGIEIEEPRKRGDAG